MLAIGGRGFSRRRGSANEALAALRVAAAWGYVAATDAEPASALLRRVVGMLWGLTYR
jgi:hypothetical protein